MADEGELAGLVRLYLERVVNQHEVALVDRMVAASYHGGGHGWPTDLPALRAFYRWQMRSRPDWRIDVQGTLEVGDCVVVRAYAGGTVAEDDAGRPRAVPVTRAVEWLAAYRFEQAQIAEIRVLALRDR